MISYYLIIYRPKVPALKLVNLIPNSIYIIDYYLGLAKPPSHVTQEQIKKTGDLWNKLEKDWSNWYKVDPEHPYKVK